MHLRLLARSLITVILCLLVLPVLHAAEAGNSLEPKGDKGKEMLQVLAKTLKPDIDQKEAGNFIELAKASYQAGRFKDALAQLDKAQVAIRQQRLEKYKTLLPPAPQGWQSQDKQDEAASMGGAMLGGMSVVSRIYTANGHELKLYYMIDSPMIDMLGSMIKLAEITPQAGDNSVVRVKGFPGSFKEKLEKDKPTRQLSLLVDGMMIMLESATLPRETFMQFADILPIEQIRQVP